MNSQNGNGFMQHIRSNTTEKLDSFFFKYGIIVAENPWKFILFSISLTSVCSLGFLNFYQEKNPMNLWIPPGSDFQLDTEWLMQEFGEGFRIQTVLITAPDVLQPSVLQQLDTIHHRVIESMSHGYKWEDVCFRVPVIEMNYKRRRSVEENKVHNHERNTTTEKPFISFDPSVYVSSEIFCGIVQSFDTGCYEHSLLEFWKYNTEEIQHLTKNEIIDSLNHTMISPVLGLSMDYTHLLGGIVRNESGVIIAASSLISQWMVHVNFSIVDMDEVGNAGGTADWATGPGMAWEQNFLETMAIITSELNDDEVEIFYEAGRSFGDISSAAMFQDFDKIFTGVTLMFCYVVFGLSRCNLLDIRIIPAGAGMLCIGLAYVSSCGLCSALGIHYGPVHTSLPFLLMGIGVDDMFVIMACHYERSDDKNRHTLPIHMGLVLRHAGVSITVTSFTDIVASTIGGTTIMPTLESFCLYAAAGVLMIFIYQLTFFVPFLILDERRLRKSQVTKKKIAQPKQHVKPCMSKKLIHFLYSKVFLSKCGKILLLISTLVLAGFSIRGNIYLKQKFDPKWFLPSNSYVMKFLNAQEKWYSDSGQDAFIFFGRLNYSSELSNMNSLIDELRKRKHIVKDIDTWYEGFRFYLNNYYGKDIPHETLTEEEFSTYLGKFLFSPRGGKYQPNFRFADKLKCGSPAPPITVSSLNFKFKLFSGPEEALPAMNEVKSLVKNSNIESGDGFKTVWSKVFANWVTDEIIHRELYRNLILAVICVMLTTFVLILNLQACFWIFLCVALTLLDVCGIMYYWGMTVDNVSCVALVLAVGLCVDYATHVGQTFLKCEGTRSERVMETVETIGTAVINGGISTLLSLSVLSLSDTYIYMSFFKIFLLVVVLGLFHGVVFLPVIFSLVGPGSQISILEFDLTSSKSSDSHAKSINLKLEEEEVLN